MDSDEAKVGEARIDFECGFTDTLCQVNEWYANNNFNGAISTMTTALESTAFTTDGTLWVTAATEFSWWRWVVIVAIIGAGIVGVTMGAVKRDGEMIKHALIGLVLTYPLTEIAVWTLGHLLNGTEALSNAVMARGDTSSLPARLLEMGSSFDNEDQFLVAALGTMLFLGSLVLLFVFSFRNLGLMVLIAFAPLAFMFAPTRPGVRTVTRWAAAVAALLLTKPLTLGLLSLVITGLDDLETLWTPEAFTIGFGLLLALFMPFMAFALFDFLGTSAANSFEGGSRAVGAGAVSQSRAATMTATAGARSLGRSIPGVRGAGGAGAQPRPAVGASPGGAKPSTAPSPRPAPTPAPRPTQ